MTPIMEVHSESDCRFVRARRYQVSRNFSAALRVVDYLRALGVPTTASPRCTCTALNDTAIVLTRDDLLRHPDDVLFKFAGDTSANRSRSSATSKSGRRSTIFGR